MTTYSFDTCIIRLKQAIDFAEDEGDFTQIRVWAHRAEEAYREHMADAVSSLVALSDPPPTGEQADIARWTPEEKEADEVAKNFNFDSIAPIEF